MIGFRALLRAHSDDRTALLLRPSWLSGTLSALAGLVLVFAVAGSIRFQGSFLQQQLADWQNGARTETVDAAYHAAVVNDGLHMLVDKVFTVVFWGAIGLITFVVAYAIIEAFQKLAALRAELHYANTNHRKVLIDALTRAGVRVLALAALWICIRLYVGMGLLFAIATAQVASEDLPSLRSIAQLVLAWCIVSGGLHVLVVLARLVALKSRLFMAIR